MSGGWSAVGGVGTSSIWFEVHRIEGGPGGGELRASASCWSPWAMWRCSASTMRRVSCWGCVSAACMSSAARNSPARTSPTLPAPTARLDCAAWAVLWPAGTPPIVNWHRAGCPAAPLLAGFVTLYPASSAGAAPVAPGQLFSGAEDGFVTLYPASSAGAAPVAPGQLFSGAEDGVGLRLRVGWQAEVFGGPEFGVAVCWSVDVPVVVVDEVVAGRAEGGEVGDVCRAVV